MMMPTDASTITADTDPDPEADRYMTPTIAGPDSIGGRGQGRVPEYGLFEGGEVLDIAMKISLMLRLFVLGGEGEGGWFAYPSLPYNSNC